MAQGALGMDAATLEICTVEATDYASGDAPMLPCLLNQIGANKAIASVSGDGAYDTKAGVPRKPRRVQ